MNPYDFYYLEDFLRFSPFSPNHANLNMVSSPRFRSPGTRSASAIVPVPENSSVAYHKEIYTVLFYPPSFLMVYSIVCHLRKKSKIKKFLPLPLIRKSQQEPSCTSISEAADEFSNEHSCNSISEVEDEFSNSSTCVHESSSYKFIFGNFHRSDLDAVTLDPAIVIKPKSNGTAIKFGEISCSLSLVKFDPVNLDSAKSTENRSIPEISFSCFEDYSIDAVPAIRYFKLRLCLDEFAKLYSEMLIQSPEKTVVCTATAMVKFPLDSSDFRFDPGGIMSVIYSFAIMLFILSIFNSVPIFPFDPGGIFLCQ